MRPSRSHESLSSPLKQNRLNSMQQTITGQFMRLNQTTSTMKSNRYSQPTTPLIKNKPNSYAASQHQIVDSLIRLNLNELNHPAKQNQTVLAHSLHNSLLNEENCFEIKSSTSNITIISLNTSDFNENENENEQINNEEDDIENNEYDPNKTSSESKQTLKYYNSVACFGLRYFMCRSSDERDKWIQCLRSILQPSLVNTRRDENALQLWILEAKGQTISSKPNKKYFCEILLNGNVYARTCCKDKKDILFWGENFDFK